MKKLIYIRREDMPCLERMDGKGLSIESAKHLEKGMAQALIRIEDERALEALRREIEVII